MITVYTDGACTEHKQKKRWRKMSYMETLDNREGMTAKHWILEDLAGKIVRDLGIGLSAKELRARIRAEMQETMDWNRSQRAAYEEELEVLAKRTRPEWEKIMKEENRAIVAANAKNAREALRIKKRRAVIKDQLLKIKSADIGDFTRKNVEYGLKILETREHDTAPHLSAAYLNVNFFILKGIKHVKWMIYYHTKEIKKKIAQREETIREYLELQRDLKRFG